MKEYLIHIPKKTKPNKGRLKHGLSDTRQHIIWQHMRQRCNNPKDKNYHNYGGRGIKVCAEWEMFENFWRDMVKTYSPKLSLDRIDVNGNYSLENCRWATAKQQGNNTRRTRKVSYFGETKSLKEWAEYFGINYQTFMTRILNGTFEEAIKKEDKRKYNKVYNKYYGGNK
jgi:hypothetical protein